MGRSARSHAARHRWTIALCGLGITLLGTTAATIVARAPDIAARDRAARQAPPRVVLPEPVASLPPSKPVALEIPRLRVRTELLSLGKNADGTLQVPTRGQVQKAGWYRYGPSPGSTGPAVIAGHVDSPTGPAIFYRLGELRPGDQVTVLRNDRRTAVFRITKVERVDKDRFPTRKVYGAVSYPGIRLITCTGEFNRETGAYTQNVIAYGRLVQST